MAEAEQVYTASPVKRKRRTQAELAELQAALYAEITQAPPYTVRQAYYQMSVQGMVPKTEAGYDVVQRELLKMRRAGKLPYSAIADSTRWMRKPRSYSSMEEALLETARSYRLNLWRDADVYVEIWLEKDALAGVIKDVTFMYDVPLMVARGFSSDTFLYPSGMHAASVGKPCYYYYFGDHDPSGVMIDRKVEEQLRAFAPNAEIHFQRVAITTEQIERWGLPTRPTKKTDSRAKNFQGESCELDSVPVNLLRKLVRDCIEQHIDPDRLRRLKAQEQLERESWMETLGAFDRVAS